MDVYTFDQQAVKILESAIRYLEFEMRTFEDKKELMGTQLKKDLKLIRLIISKIKKRPILMSDILTLFKNQPELTKIN